MDHTGVEWGGSCRGHVDNVGSDGSCRDGVDHTGVGGWVI